MGQISNINIRSRFTQVIVLVAAIVITSLFSQVANAQSSVRYGHKKFRIAVHKNSNKACYILNKKRMSMAKRDMIASSRRSSRNNKSMAETDGIGVASSN